MTKHTIAWPLIKANVPFKAFACGETSCKYMPTSLRKPIATCTHNQNMKICLKSTIYHSHLVFRTKAPKTTLLMPTNQATKISRVFIFVYAHTSTLSSVGFSNNKVIIWSANTSWATCWFTKCAMNRTLEVHNTLSLRLYPRRKFRIRRFKTSSPFSGNYTINKRKQNNTSVYYRNTCILA